MMIPPDVSMNGWLMSQHRRRRMRRPGGGRPHVVRRGHGPLLGALVALGIAGALERLINIQIDDHLAAIMLTLIVAVIVIVAIAPSRPS